MLGTHPAKEVSLAILQVTATYSAFKDPDNYKKLPCLLSYRAIVRTKSEDSRLFPPSTVVSPIECLSLKVGDGST